MSSQADEFRRLSVSSARKTRPDLVIYQLGCVEYEITDLRILDFTIRQQIN